MPRGLASPFPRRGDRPKHHAERRLETPVWTDLRPGSGRRLVLLLALRSRMRGPRSLPSARPMTGGSNVLTDVVSLQGGLLGGSGGDRWPRDHI